MAVFYVTQTRVRHGYTFFVQALIHAPFTVNFETVMVQLWAGGGAGGYTGNLGGLLGPLMVSWAMGRLFQVP